MIQKLLYYCWFLLAIPFFSELGVILIEIDTTFSWLLAPSFFSRVANFLYLVSATAIGAGIGAGIVYHFSEINKRYSGQENKEKFEKGKEFYDKEKYSDAIQTWRHLAEKNYAEAQYNLGMMYYEGYGVRRDDQKAFEWFEKAAKQKHAKAQFSLGGMYRQGLGVPENNGEAIKWYSKAADQKNIDALNNLGGMYGQGLGVEKDYVQALTCYKKAADQGNTEAQFNLGNMYNKGQGVGKDYGEAVEWYTQAAKQGNASAQNNLGVMYHQGQGVKADLNQAFKWYRKSATQGYARAQYNLGRMCAQEVTQNDIYACMWLILANTNGVKEAQKIIETLIKYMSSEDIDKAQKLAQKCLDSDYEDCGDDE